MHLFVHLIELQKRRVNHHLTTENFNIDRLITKRFKSLEKFGSCPECDHFDHQNIKFKNRRRKGSFYKEIAYFPVESSDAVKKALSKQSNPVAFVVNL
ncbi:hypothetical protein BpHYR1_003798 [Brachionus plicatilis]|uniref:Uncharacterized protein n=1 Tax=Brachionus plicatilis TaxID=10195 RepID=A0A3M7RNP1_BRAPC|nr:hypothetical protein BpHYR1_003798 [Brachionus plicatilis]